MHSRLVDSELLRCSNHRQLSVLSLLPIRRGRIEPAGEHYGLGVGGISEAVWGRVDYEVGYFSLCVWSAASSGVSGEVCGEFEAGVAAGADGGSGKWRGYGWERDSSR